MLLREERENKECNISVSTLSTVTLNEDYSEYVSKLISQKKETEKYMKVESVVRYGSRKKLFISHLCVKKNVLSCVQECQNHQKGKA